MDHLVRTLFGQSDSVRIEVYDGTSIGPSEAPTIIRIASPRFFDDIILGRASELAFGRAYVLGHVDIEGDIYCALTLLGSSNSFSLDPRIVLEAAEVIDLRHLSRSLLPSHREIPPEEFRPPRGRRHSRQRDAQAISNHYDVSNDFYRLFLDSSMTYSCGLFENEDTSLEAAQMAKYDLICHKLALQPGQRLLDIGCGWGGMAIYAAQHYGVRSIGITLSTRQTSLARQRVADAGLSDRVEIRHQDYRDVDDHPFDAVSSIGMFEHVGQEQLKPYFAQIHSLLVPEGRLLNHAINRSTGRSRGQIDSNGFVSRYVFPDGFLLESGQVVSAINGSGLEVRHLESLRRHYALTLREWVHRLETSWEEAVAQISVGRAKVWRIYMAGSALAFESNQLNLTQILATKTTDGLSGFDLAAHW